MNNINEILNFSFDFVRFTDNAKKVISGETIKKMQKNQTSLEKIINYDISDVIPPENQIRKMYLLFVSNYGNSQLLDEIFSKRKNVRVLCNCLTYQENDSIKIIQNKSLLKIALNYIENKWRDSFLSTIFHTLLREWVNIDTHNVVRPYLINKLKGYDGKKLKLQILKKYIHFFFISGEAELGEYIANKDLSLLAISGVWTF